MDTQPSVAMISNDWQGTFYDPEAFEVACQIGEYFQPDILGFNGDLADLPGMSLKYVQRNQAEKYKKNFSEELDHTKLLIAQMCNRAKPRKGVRQRRKFTEGNHEWRLWRALHAIPAVKEILSVKKVEKALSMSSLLGLTQLGFQCAGEYPSGIWLFGTGNPNTDVWMEHGYMSSKRAGYTGTRLREDRMTNIIMGHVERAALTYQHVVGGRDFFAIENGNLSILGRPKKGDRRYSSVPFNVGDYANRQQAVSIITKIGSDLFPQLIPIVNGAAVVGGKVFRA